MNEITRVLKLQLPGAMIEVVIHSEAEFIQYSQKWQINDPLQLLTVSSFTQMPDGTQKIHHDYKMTSLQFKHYPRVVWANFPK